MGEQLFARSKPRRVGLQAGLTSRQPGLKNQRPRPAFWRWPRRPPRRAPDARPLRDVIADCPLTVNTSRYNDNDHGRTAARFDLSTPRKTRAGTDRPLWRTQTALRIEDSAGFSIEYMFVGPSIHVVKDVPVVDRYPLNKVSVNQVGQANLYLPRENVFIVHCD